MKNHAVPVILSVIIALMSMLSGCSTDLISVGVQDTPVPQIIDRPAGTIPSSVAPEPVPIQQKSPAIPPTISPECRDLAAAADADRAFLKVMIDRNVYANVSSLAVKDCTISYATQASQMISTSPKPRTPVLAEARETLLLASTECLEPANSASRRRTRDNLDMYVGKVSRYAYLLSSCGDRSGDDIAASLKRTVEKEDETLLRSTGTAAPAFSTGGTGSNTTFAFTYTGSSSYVAMLQDRNLKNIDLIANCAGSCEGKRSIGLYYGRYVLNVSTTGPWSVLVTPPR